MNSKLIRTLTLIGILLALLVTLLGAYTRLTDAGLGCPDWPKCYGNYVMPTDKDKLNIIQDHYPDAQIETFKAWTEMVHRYAAGILGLLIFAIFLVSFKNRKNISLKYPILLVGLVFFQAILGMWTVVFKLLPIVVVAHLFGGFFIFSLLVLFYLQENCSRIDELNPWRNWLIAGAVLVILQIFLGGMVSTNYAGLACVGFPTCNGNWIPNLEFSQGLFIIEPINGNYEGGVLSTAIRVLIQYIHRIMGMIILSFTMMLSILLLSLTQSSRVRYLTIGFALVVISQFILGVLNVLLLLPIWTAVLHNGFAAIMLALILSMVWFSGKSKINAF